jgi:chemotaxis protein histidine kinase CheA/ActR/RegA family two-component response regulator
MRNMSNTFDKLSVLDSFLEEVNSYLPEIETNLERLTQSPSDMDALEETYRRTHTIGGSASMMDFPGLAHVAHGMEDVLADALDGLISLDEAALGLLRRSLGRLHQLLQGIHTDIDEESVTAEDDADYARYRAVVEGVGSTSPAIPRIGNASAVDVTDEIQQQMVASAPSAPVEMSLPAPSTVPSFDEVLASFRTPSVNAGEEMAWPEDPIALLGNMVAPQAKIGHTEAPLPSTAPLADEVLASFRTTLVNSSQETTWPEDPIMQLGNMAVPQAEINHAEASLPSTAPLADEVLASFRTTLVNSGQETARSEAPSTARLEYMASRRAEAEARPAYVSSSPIDQVRSDHVYHLPPDTVRAELNLPTALEELVASTRPPSAAPTSKPAPAALNLPAVPSTPRISDLPAYHQMPVEHALPEQHEQEAEALPQIYDQMQKDTQVIVSQASSLTGVAALLRQAMAVIERQRSEFKSFLSGSQDALERMEDWAGQAMGLNLRNSPEQVRRYLPLSVMWVANSKLKKALDLLAKVASGVETTDEQIASNLQQLHASMQSFGQVFQQWEEEHAAHVLRQEPGWSPWEMQAVQDSRELRERVTFERQGNLAALRAELEAKIRNELQDEYARYVSPIGRVELEQQIRQEVRQEFEDRLRLQQAASLNEARDEDIQQLKARLRSEIEIQVRQEFLGQLAQLGGELGTQAAKMAAQSNSNGVNHISGAASFVAPESLPVLPVAPLPASPAPAPSPVAAMGGDFGEEALEIFRMEAEEHMQTISMQVTALKENTTDRNLIQNIRRATHTLKGAAGMMGFRAIADLCHVFEDLLDIIMEGSMGISPAVLSIILDTSETLDLLITSNESDVSDGEAKVRALQARYVGLLGERSTVRDVNEPIDLDMESEAQVYDTSHIASVLTDEQGDLHDSNVPRTGRGDLAVRVRLQRLDELVNLFGELLVSRSVLEERIQRLVRIVADVGVSSNRLRDVGQKLESRFEAATLPSGRSVQVMPGQGNQKLLPAPGMRNGNGNGSSMPAPAHLAEFDELELDRYTEFHQLARGLSEGISDMITLSSEMDTLIREAEGVFARENRLSATFQDRLMKTRLVPLSQLTPRLYQAARAVAIKQGKELEFLREGEATEVDRTVFEEISGPLLHLVRNAVNHALEIPEVRTRKGKSLVGQVKFSASYEGNQIVISVSDDGKGLDREHIRHTAIMHGMIRPDQQLTEKDLVSFIFTPGFSTADVVSEESGRGVGLDVVGDTVSRLRGTIVVESMPEKGTTFTMIFPTSLAIQRAMMVRISNQQFVIPTVHVESIGRFDTFKHMTVAGRPAVMVRNEPYPLLMLAQYLSLPIPRAIDDKAQLILVNAGGHHVALVVDEIKGQADIVMKNLGPHLRQVHGIAGASVLGNGQVVLVLELNSLLSTRLKGISHAGIVASTSREATSLSEMNGTVKYQLDVPASRPGIAPLIPTPPATPVPERGKHLLVVDDSPSVRRVVSNMLKQHGWEVQMARDGVEALEMISYETPAGVLLDIEMPRMDGYELISTVRAQEQYRTLPMIVLTSRAAAKHQQRAMSLGASAYVVKPYQDEELLNTISSLVFGTAAQAVR